MTYGRSNLRLKFRRGIAFPEYLDESKHRLLVEAVIGFYEENVGKKFGEIDWDELKLIVGCDKLYKGLRKVMERYYRPEMESLRQTVNPKVLRLRVFKLVNELYGGFVPSGERRKALKYLEELLGVEDLEEVLWQDMEYEKPLKRIFKPSVRDVVEAYNFETVDTICINSSSLKIEVEGQPGILAKIAKVLGRTCKHLGLVYDARAGGNWMKTLVEGPRSLFGKPTRYGLRLTLLLTRMLPILVEAGNWRVTSRTHFTRRTLTIRVLSSRRMPSISPPRKLGVQPAFDSEVEERIYWTLKALGLEAIREPEPIALGDLIYIPDFKIVHRGREFYIEVAGYWRKEYAEKKAYKLSEVAKLGKNIIVLADEKLKPYLRKVKAPIIYYTVRRGRPVLPYKKLLDIVRGRSEDVGIRGKR